MNSDYVEDREELNTQNMLEQGFLTALKTSNKGNGKQLAKTVEQAMSVEESSVTKTASNNFNTEKLLMDLYEIRDGLLSTFGSINHNSVIASDLTGQINKIGSCIVNLGGEVESFDPLDHISGLNAPNLDGNAKKVIALTKECYNLGNVGETLIKDNGKTIVINFDGKEGDVNYNAIGTITAAHTWTGNEAIDYVYTPASGKLSVKSLNDNGKWIDKSASFEIYWELEEYSDEDINEKSDESKEEVIAETENKIMKQDDDISEDFPIEEE